MAYNIEGFKANIEGIQRSSLFLVSMVLPSSLEQNLGTGRNLRSVDTQKYEKDGVNFGYLKKGNDSRTYTQMFSFLCKSADIPSDTVGVIEVPFMGRKIKYFGDRQYTDWSTTIMIDSDWSVYNQLYNWHRAMNRQNGNYASKDSMNLYKVDVYVQMYYQTGRVSSAFKLVGAFPSDIQTINASWENNDTVAECSVSWAFDYWTTDVVSVKDRTDTAIDSYTHKDVSEAITDYTANNGWWGAATSFGK